MNCSTLPTASYLRRGFLILTLIMFASCGGDDNGGGTPQIILLREIAQPIKWAMSSMPERTRYGP